MTAKQNFIFEEDSMKGKKERQYFCDWFESKKNKYRLLGILTLISLSASAFIVSRPSFEGSITSKIIRFILGTFLFLLAWSMIILVCGMLSMQSKVSFNSHKLNEKLDYLLLMQKYDPCRDLTPIKRFILRRNRINNE